MIAMRRLSCLALITIAAIVACTDSSEPSAPRRLLYMSMSPYVMYVEQGDSAVASADLSSTSNFSGVPQVVVSGAPDGVTSQVQVTQANGRFAHAVITLHVNVDATPGKYTLSLVATDPGADPVSVPFDVTVTFKPMPCVLTEQCRQWALSATASSEYSPDEWAAYQATGAPNVMGCSDDPRSWASAEPGNGEWLELTFAQSVVPTRVEIFENLTASSIVRVAVKDELGVYHTVYTATPKVTECPRVLAIPVTNVDVKVKGVIIYFDQVLLGYWSEIDAVMLIGNR